MLKRYLSQVRQNFGSFGAGTAGGETDFYPFQPEPEWEERQKTKKLQQFFFSFLILLYYLSTQKITSF